MELLAWSHFPDLTFMPKICFPLLQRWKESIIKWFSILKYFCFNLGLWIWIHVYQLAKQHWNLCSLCSKPFRILMGLLLLSWWCSWWKTHQVLSWRPVFCQFCWRHWKGRFRSDFISPVRNHSKINKQESCNAVGRPQFQGWPNCRLSYWIKISQSSSQIHETHQKSGHSDIKRQFHGQSNNEASISFSYLFKGTLCWNS